MKKKNECGIFEKEGLFGKRGTKRGPLLAIFLKKSLRGTKNPKRDRLVITGEGLLMTDFGNFIACFYLLDISYCPDLGP